MPTSDRYHAITLLFADTDYEPAFKNWFRLQAVDLRGFKASDLPLWHERWTMDRRHHLDELFRNTRFGRRFREYIDQSLIDPRSITRRELWVLYKEFDQMREELAFAEQDRKAALGLQSALTDKLVGAALKPNESYDTIMKTGLHQVDQETGAPSSAYERLMQQGLRK